eukprot:26548-Pelagomonas_calceolata.AAC.3
MGAAGPYLQKHWVLCWGQDQATYFRPGCKHGNKDNTTYGLCADAGKWKQTCRRGSRTHGWTRGHNMQLQAQEHDTENCWCRI